MHARGCISARLHASLATRQPRAATPPACAAGGLDFVPVHESCLLLGLARCESHASVRCMPLGPDTSCQAVPNRASPSCWQPRAPPRALTLGRTLCPADFRIPSICVALGASYFQRLLAMDPGIQARRPALA